MAEITSAKAMARTVRVSPRKTRLVLDLIRGKNVADAIAILKFTPNKAARIVEKTLNSAIANAENNFGLEKAKMCIRDRLWFLAKRVKHQNQFRSLVFMVSLACFMVSFLSMFISACLLYTSCIFSYWLHLHY